MPGPPSPRRPLGEYPLDEIVPARAVLTELARGFLLSSDDPERAKRFAATFLREQQSGRPSPGRIVPVSRQPTVRRGVDLTSGGPPRPR